MQVADNYDQYSKEELLRLLRERDRKPKFGLVWERNEIEHDKSLNSDFVALDLDQSLSCGDAPHENLIIEGDNFDALRYLRMTHAGQVKCIYIDPPLYYPFATNSMVLYHNPSSTCSTLEGHLKSERLDAAPALWP